MNIIINNELKSVEAVSLIRLLEEIHLPNRKGIAVAVNEQVVPKSDWVKHQLQENDKIMIIKATQGG